MNGAAALARIPVGVVVERRKASNPWTDVAWRPIGVLAGAPEAAPWTMLDASDDRASFYAGLAEIALYRTETGHYRDNLSSGRPLLWVSRPKASPSRKSATISSRPSRCRPPCRRSSRRS